MNVDQQRDNARPEGLETHHYCEGDATKAPEILGEGSRVLHSDTTLNSDAGSTGVVSILHVGIDKLAGLMLVCVCAHAWIWRECMVHVLVRIKGADGEGEAGLVACDAAAHVRHEIHDRREDQERTKALN